MKLNYVKHYIAVIIATMAGGCATQSYDKMTLEYALNDTINSLYAARDAAAKERTQSDGHRLAPLGLNVCTVETKFAIDSKVDDKVGLTASGPPVTIFPVLLGGSWSKEATGDRSNTVTVTFNSSLPNCQKSTPGGGPPGGVRGGPPGVVGGEQPGGAGR